MDLCKLEINSFFKPINYVPVEKNKPFHTTEFFFVMIYDLFLPKKKKPTTLERISDDRIVRKIEWINISKKNEENRVDSLNMHFLGVNQVPLNIMKLFE